MAQRAFEELRDLFARKIIEDELVWRELQGRLDAVMVQDRQRLGRRIETLTRQLKEKGGRRAFGRAGRVGGAAVSVGCSHGHAASP